MRGKNKKIGGIGLAVMLFFGEAFPIRGQVSYVTESTVAWPTNRDQVNQEEFNFPNQMEMSKELEVLLDAAYVDYGIYLQIGDQTIFPKEMGQKKMQAGGLSPLILSLALFQKIEEGSLNLNTKILLESQMIQGQGVLSSLPLGQEYHLLTILQLMIQSDDLDAYAIIVDQLGGIEEVNRVIQNLGLQKTRLEHPNNQEIVWEGNQSTPEELANILLKLDRGQLYSETVSETAKSLLSQHGPILLATYAPEQHIFLGHGEIADNQGVEVDLLLTKNEEGELVLVNIMGQLKEGMTSPMEEISQILFRGESYARVP